MTTEVRLENRLMHHEEFLSGHSERLAALESFRAQAEFQIMNLTEQMRAVVESQKVDESDAYEELRRIIKVIALTDVIGNWTLSDPLEEITTPLFWDRASEVMYRRWGHLTAGGKRLWTKPPTVSDTTKQMIAEALKRRQEVPDA